MRSARSKYPFNQLTEVGMDLISRFDHSVNVLSLSNSIRVCGLKWARASGLLWQFSVGILPPDESGRSGIRILRIEDREDPLAPVGKVTNYVPNESDERGDAHRKYPFAKLTSKGMHVVIKVTVPKNKRVSAHQAGKIWAKKRDLDWKFRITVTADNEHLRIDRIK